MIENLPFGNLCFSRQGLHDGLGVTVCGWVQVDAVKRNCIKVLPHMLVIHLKRFEYDYETMNRWKIKDRWALLSI